MNRAIEPLLAQLNVQPILVDIGASGDLPLLWREIAPRSTYIGFDPDSREMQSSRDGIFERSIIVNKAVATGNDDEVRFYLTQSPQCSSTLRPDSASLSHYLFADLFRVEREASVSAVTLDAVLQQLQLPRIDWLKIDSQGTDLRLYRSLCHQTRSQMLAVDLEPGLIDAYEGEDLFVDTHRELLREGFWLSNLEVRGAVRMKNATLHALENEGVLSRAMAERTLPTSPGWVEASYLRTVESVAANRCDRMGYVLLWSFALLQKQLGFALDVAAEYQRTFGADETSQIMRREPISVLEKTHRHGRLAALLSPAKVARKLRTLLTHH